MRKPRHFIGSLEQYEAERAAILERSRVLKESFIYAPSNTDFAPAVKTHIQGLLYQALDLSRYEEVTHDHVA